MLASELAEMLVGHRPLDKADTAACIRSLLAVAEAARGLMNATDQDEEEDAIERICDMYTNAKEQGWIK